MGASLNLATLFVSVTPILILARFWPDSERGIYMDTTRNCRKAKVKLSYSSLRRMSTTIVETMWVILTSVVAELITLTLHAERRS